MLNKNTVIGAFILLAITGGIFWHLHVQRTRTISGVRASVFYKEAAPEERRDSERPPMWLDKNGELPPEDSPRPFKHLTDLELAAYDTSQLSDEEWLLLQNEIFFRMPKEWRDEHRKQRVELKKQAEFFKWYEEQFPGKGIGSY